MESRGSTGEFGKWEEDYRHILNAVGRETGSKMVLMNPFVLRMTRLQPLDVWKYWRGEIEN